jgi:L-asparaginase/Glu-tRNA(Gln) amidotransferase subunit D
MTTNKFIRSKIIFIDDVYLKENTDFGFDEGEELKAKIIDELGDCFDCEFLSGYNENVTLDLENICRKIAAEVENDVYPLTEAVVLDLFFAGTADRIEGFEDALPILKEAEIPVIIHSSVDKVRDIYPALKKYSGVDFAWKGDPGKNIKKSIQNIINDFPRPRKNQKAVLITHGTDTMAWGFSVLKYMLKGLNFNIAITGSMEPLNNKLFATSDAIGNVHSALLSLYKMPPPSLSFIFDNGKKLFQNHIFKQDQQAADAFIGPVDARVKNHEFSFSDPRKYFPFIGKIKNLIVIPTGGTIDSQFEEGKGFCPTGNLVISYLTAELQQYYEEITTSSLNPSVDSSNMTMKRWQEIAQKIDRYTPDGCESDLYGFDPGVKIIYLNPFISEDDYNYYLNAANGIVILGYGSGNGNIECCEHSKIDNDQIGYCANPQKASFAQECAEVFTIHPCAGHRIREDNSQEKSTEILSPCAGRSCKNACNTTEFVAKCFLLKKYVVMCSQAPAGPCDFEYQTGLNLIRAGAIPGADMSIAEAHTKLSYILGHMEYMEEKIRQLNDRKNISLYQVVCSSMLAGVSFRSEQSRTRYLKLMEDIGRPVVHLAENPFIFEKFEYGLKIILESLENIV